MTKVIITGSRHGCPMVRKVLKEFHAATPITFLIHGGAGGVDAQAHTFANEFKIPIKIYPAAWGSLGKSAGPFRNRTMLEEHPDAIVLVFPGGIGTHSCETLANEKGMAVIKVGREYEP
jgi:hypothetical protein